MLRRHQRVGYWSAGLALVMTAAALGLTGHGLPALGMRMLDGEAWLADAANHSASLISGYAGLAAGQARLPGMSGQLQVVNTPDGAVVADQQGHLAKISNADFTASAAIELFGGAPATAAAGGDALYAVNESSGQIQQLNGSGAQLVPVGPRITVGVGITSPVVAPDGSLYVAIPAKGSIGHVADGRLTVIGHAGRPGDHMAVVLAGSVPVAADLTSGTVARIGATEVSGHVAHAPAGFRATEAVGSDTVTGLVGLVGGHAVATVDAISGGSAVTALPAATATTAAALQGRLMVLVNSPKRDVLIVNTATHRVQTTVMPGRSVPDGVTVKDRLVFVNDSDGASALVINGSGAVRTVTKYTVPPPNQHPHVNHRPIPAPHRSQGPPRPPGPPLSPAALAGNAEVTLGWKPAAANGSALISYLVSWRASTGAAGRATVPGTATGTIVRALSNGAAYLFTIRAVNGVGTGPAALAGPVTPSSKVPGAPGAVTAAASQPTGSATLTWHAADNGYHIASYTIWEAGVTAPLLTGVTGTTATVNASQGLAAGTSVRFQVSAVSTAGTSGPKSPPSQPVTPFLPPTAPTVTSTVAQAGTSATLAVSCPVACQQGRPPKSYTVTVSPGGTPITVVAAASGAPVTVPVSGLTANTSYTVTATVTDTAKAAGPAATLTLSTPGPPSVSGVTVSASGLTLTVTATVGTGGLPTTCTVTVNGASGAGACSGISIGVPVYNTTYQVTFTANNPDGLASGGGSGRSGLKPLIADATTAFGTCPSSHPYCGGNSDIEPTPKFVSGAGTPVAMGTQELAGCWTTGAMDYGNISPYSSGSNVWVYIPAAGGYMSILWFPSPYSVSAQLPQASRC